MATEVAKKALRLLVKMGNGEPVKAVAFGRAMWPEPGAGPIPRSNPRRNLLAGGYLSKLVKLGLVERVYYEDRFEVRGYRPTPDGLREIDPTLLVNILK